MPAARTGLGQVWGFVPALGRNGENMTARVIRFMAVTLLVAGVVAAAPGRASASFLTPAHESRLETWLGEGNVTFTNVFASAAGDGQDLSDFHAAVDGKGRTVTLIRLAGTFEGQIIGGYNPQSWRSAGGYTRTPSDADRTAFLFNLTTDALLRQRLTTENFYGSYYGEYQAFNDQGNIWFGGGADLYISGGLDQGRATQLSYGQAASNYGVNVVGRTGYSTPFAISGIEVYTIAAAPNATPAPAGLVLALAGSACLGGFGWVRRRRRTADV